MLGLTSCDERFDAELAHESAVFVVVVTAVGDQRSGQRGRPRRPATAGTASRSGISWVTSLRLPAVIEKASGIPVASTRRWCLQPGRPLSTGLGPVSAPPFSLAPGSSRRSPATTRARPRPATVQARAHAAAPRHLPVATRRGDASRSPLNGTPARPAAAARRSRCAERTRSLAAPTDRRSACDRDNENDAPASAKAARSTPTSRPRRSTAQRPSAPLPVDDGCRGLRRQGRAFLSRRRRALPMRAAGGCINGVT